MFTICDNCGNIMKNQTINKRNIGYMKCDCGNEQKYIRINLFILTGASGVGKSTIGRRLMENPKSSVVVLESDILWCDYYNKPETNYREYREKWLSLCKNIGQAGKPILLVGCGIPDQYENTFERQFFNEICYISLVTSRSNLEKQLRDRPAFRNCNTPEYIKQQQEYNEWNRNNWAKTEPQMKLVNIEKLSVQESVKKVEEIFLSYNN